MISLDAPTAPWVAIFPGVMITLAATSLNFLGDGLRDALDPRHVRSREFGEAQPKASRAHLKDSASLTGRADRGNGNG